jgi:hypothetical protein
MFRRALVLSLGFAALAGLSSGFAFDDEKPKQEPEKPKRPEDPKGPKDEPKKPEVPRDPKDEPKKPKDEPKKPEEPKGPKDEPKKPKEEPKKEPVPTAPPFAKSPPKAPTGLKKYDEVVTKEAKTQKGIFDVHLIPNKEGTVEKVLYEIPADRLGADKLFLWRAELAKAAAGGGGMGGGFNGAELGKKFLRFVRKDNKLLVYQANYDKRATDKANAAAVEAVQNEPIIGTLGVLAEGKDRSVVVDATNTIMQDSLSVGATRAAGMGGSISSDASFLGEVKAFPTNIEARATLTFRGGAPMGGGPGGPPGGGFSLTPRVSTTVVHYSLVGLPDEPMQGRLFDPRVGYFVEDFQEFGKKGWVTEKAFINRFRLEKKNKSADVSEPERPIVFYLAPEIPEKWRAAIKKGVEDWQPAFEKAGFKNAIKAEDAPKDLDPEDTRYSVIRWVADGVANAMGPHVHDPRSGEIISAHIIFWHDIVKLTHMWYFVQCSAQDERARKLPFPDDLTAELIRYVAAHEVGHTLGLRHNHRASQAYSIDQLRDPKFVEKHGNVASIMSYGRYNYVAQPEDKIPAKDLIPKLAPYDYFAIEWGYKPVSGASTPEEEKKTLDEWASRQIKEPFLRFGGEDGPTTVDPTVLTENIGNDPVEATRLGLKNVDKVLDHMIAATTEKGEDYELLAEAYQEVLGHRARWYSAVAKQVGGLVESRTLAGRGGVQFNRVPEERQKAAVKFLLESAFKTPKKLLDPELVNQFKYTGISSTIGNQQKGLLAGLMSSTRLNRLLDAEVQNPDAAYTVGELVGDVKAGVWSELGGEAVKVDPLRRGLQREFIDLLKAEFDPAPAAGGLVIGQGRRGPSFSFEPPARSSELRAIARVALKELRQEIEAAAPKAKDPATKAHLADSIASIDDALEGAAKKK